MKKDYVWHKQSIAVDLEIIDCRVYDDIKDFSMDLSGCYVLIRIDIPASLIEVAICDKQHTITHSFRGKKSQDIYHAIFDYEKKNNLQIIETLFLNYQKFNDGEYIKYLIYSKYITSI